MVVIADVRTVLVHAHPSSDSFSRRLRDTAERVLRANGHDVTVIDLYEEGFDPRMTREERLRYESDDPIVDPQVRRYADLVTEAEMLVFVYPTWWFGMPAILKGWIERVFVPGVSFVFDDANRPRPGLLRLRRLVGISTYGSTRGYMRFFNDAGRRVIRRSVSVLAPPLRVRTTWFGRYHMDVATPADRDAFVARVERGLARL